MSSLRFGFTFLITLFNVFIISYFCAFVKIRKWRPRPDAMLIQIVAFCPAGSFSYTAVSFALKGSFSRPSVQTVFRNCLDGRPGLGVCTYPWAFLPPLSAAGLRTGYNLDLLPARFIGEILPASSEILPNGSYIGQLLPCAGPSCLFEN